MKKFVFVAALALVSASFALDLGAAKKAASNGASEAVTATKEAARTEVNQTTNAVLGTPDTAKKAEAAPAVDTTKKVAAPAADSSKIQKKAVKSDKKAAKKSAKSDKKAAKTEKKAAAKK